MKKRSKVVRSETIGGLPVTFHADLVLAVRTPPDNAQTAAGCPMCFVDLAYGGFLQLGEPADTVAEKVWGKVDV